VRADRTRAANRSSRGNRRSRNRHSQRLAGGRGRKVERRRSLRRQRYRRLLSLLAPAGDAVEPELSRHVSIVLDDEENLGDSEAFITHIKILVRLAEIDSYHAKILSKAVRRRINGEDHQAWWRAVGDSGSPQGQVDGGM